MSNFITKNTITRLIKDVKQITNSPLTDHGIYYQHDENDILKGYALIIGPTDTPYFGGNYLFELKYPTDFPHSPPTVEYCTNGNNIRFNPNLYKCGKVCVSLLNTWNGDQWTSCQTISTVLLTLCSLLCQNPLLNEPGVNKKHIDLTNYNFIIEYSNINIAVCDIVDKKSVCYNNKFDKLYPFIKDNFIKNYDELVKFTENKINHEFKNEKNRINTSMYNMSVDINYYNMLEKLKKTKLSLG